MTPGEASAKGALLMIDHPAGGVRQAAHVFDTGAGIAYVDLGWTENETGHVVHLLEGEVLEDPAGWLLITRDGEDVPMWQASNGRNPDGARETAWAMLREEFQLGE